MPGESTAQGLIDESCRREFEAAWHSGAPVPIEQCLPPPNHALYHATLEELIYIDLEFAWRCAARSSAGAQPTASERALVENYLERFPCLNRPEVVMRLIEQEFRIRHRAGDQVSSSEYQERFPNLDLTLREIHASLHDRDHSPNVPAQRAAGARLGRYQLAAEHARGGFGLVWRAQDELLEREVALKELSKSHTVQPSLRQRFVAEARIAAQLQHPGIVPVYDLGDVDGQEPYYTMKLVQGQTLAEAIRRFHDPSTRFGEKPVEQMRLLNAFLAVTRAMAYAHSRGVIHRDLKPDNILLGEFGETIILDWGLAKIVGERTSHVDLLTSPAPANGRADVTQPGTVMGTPAYMSPEQAEGRTTAVDTRSDIYALGAILYQLLTGRRPFEGDSADEVLHEILTASPPRPRAIDHGIPRSLESICLCALSRDPEHRYAEVGLMTRDLERYLADEPVTAYRELWHERAGRWIRRHRTAVTAAGVAILLATAAGVGGLFLWQAGEHRRQTQAESHLAELRKSAESGEAFALAELRAGRFSAGEKILRQAVETIQGEPRLASFHDRLAAQRDRAFGLVEFYRLADDAERLAFLEYDEEALAACETALRHLELLKKTNWVEHLPADVLTEPGQSGQSSQLDQLREDVYRTLMLLSALQIRPVLLKGTNDPDVVPACRAALATVRQYHQFRPSFAGRLVEVFCRLRLGEIAGMGLPTLREPTSTADYYFTGMAHGWLAHAPKDAISQMLLLGPARALTGMDFATPEETSQRLLRAALDREPRHYWTHFWLAWTYASSGDFKTAAQSYEACVALRPDYALGYAFRGHATVRAAQGPSVPASRREEFEKRGLQDLRRAVSLDPHEPFLHWLQAQTLFALRSPNEELRAYGRMLELERPLESWRGRRVFDEKKTVIAGIITRADEVLIKEPNNIDARSIRAQASFALGKVDDAGRDVEHVLRLRPTNLRALTVRGHVYLHRDDFDHAVNDLRAGFATGYPPAVWGYAEALAGAGKHEESLHAFERLSEVAVTDWQRLLAFRRRWEILTKLGRQEQARNVLEAAKSLNPVAAVQFAEKDGKNNR